MMNRDEQSIRRVTISELRHRASEVVRGVRDGDRLIVTRHSQPQGVILSIRDAIELFSAVDLERLAVAGARERKAGEVVRPWPELCPLRIEVSRSATSNFDRLAGADRGGIRRSLLNGEGPIFWLKTGKWLCGSLRPEPGVVLIYALISTLYLERSLIGEAIYLERQRADIDRAVHDRGSTPKRLGGQP